EPRLSPHGHDLHPFVFIVDALHDRSLEYVEIPIGGVPRQPLSNCALALAAMATHTVVHIQNLSNRQVCSDCCRNNYHRQHGRNCEHQLLHGHSFQVGCSLHRNGKGASVARALSATTTMTEVSRVTG